MPKDVEAMCRALDDKQNIAYCELSTCLVILEMIDSVFFSSPPDEMDGEKLYFAVTAAKSHAEGALDLLNEIGWLISYSPENKPNDSKP